MTAKDRISVRVDEGQRDFLREIGHDADKPRGAISRGVAAVIEFAQKNRKCFSEFMYGEADKCTT